MFIFICIEWRSEIWSLGMYVNMHSDARREVTCCPPCDQVTIDT